ncbi:LPS export ABC transporter periplasmic protein LptC [Hymenobacter sp. HD11105]
MLTRNRSWMRFLGGILLMAGLSTACQKNETEVKKKIVYTGPLIEASNVTMLISDSAKLQIKLTAPLQQNFENGDQVYPKGMTVMFFSKDGSVINTLSGKYGRYDKAKDLYLVRNDVRVSNEEKQQKMNSEELYYDKQKAIIYTDKFVRVETPTEILTGTGLTANQDFSRYKILKPAGIFTVEAPPTE